MTPLRRPALVAFTACLTLCLALSASGQVTYTVVDLGDVSGFPRTQGRAVNASGQVAGIAFAVDSNGTITDERPLVISPPYTSMMTLANSFAAAWGINDAGQVTGVISTPNTTTHAFLIAPPYASMQLLDSVDAQSHGIAINSSGEIAGRAKATADSSIRAIYLQPPSYAVGEVGAIGGSYSEGIGINDSGQIVGDSSISATSADIHAYLYSGGSITDLGTLGGTYSVAVGINASGQITGASSSSGASPVHAFLTASPYSSLTDLGTLGGSNSSGAGINTSGQVVGGAQIASGTFHAFIYSGGTGMVDLNTLIPSNSGWTLTNALSINDSGQITGEGINANGDHHAFLLTPAADLAISIVAVPAIKSGRTMNYFIAVTNNGPNASSGVIVTDTLPPGTAFVSASTTQGTCTEGATVSCDLGTLAVSSRAFITVTVQVTAAAGSTLSNTATLAAASDGNTANNSATAVTKVH